MEPTEFVTVFHSYAKPRRHSFRNHRHSAFEIGYIVEGQGRYQVGERTFAIESGDIFLYHTNEPHCITDIAGERPMHLVNIQFEPRCIWEQTDGNAYLQTIFRRSLRGENRLRPGDPLYGPIREKILEAERESAGGAVGAPAIVRMCVLTILILLTRGEKELALPLPRQDPHKLAGIGRSMDYIREHLTEPLTLEALAEKAHLSRTYYCSEFKALNGVTPWDYLHILRVERALARLRGGNENILDIALSCGFNNTANFNKIFRKVTGLTPREYRRAHT